MILPISAVVPAQTSASTTSPPGVRVEHEFYGAMPTGVAVSGKRRLFVTMPRWGDPVKATVVELVKGREVPYPNRAMNDFFGRPAQNRFVSVQSVVVDTKDRLWALDTGSIQLGLNKPGLPRLWCFNLATNALEKVYTFPTSVVPTTTYLNDVRFDLTRGRKGYAFITDSSAYGDNRIIVLDLATGKSWARLVNHPSVVAEKDKSGAMPIVMRTAEGYSLLARPKPNLVKRPSLGADGIAIFPRADRLVWCQLISRHAYQVPITALINPNLTDEQVAAQVTERIKKPGSDGLHEAPMNRLLITDFENARVTEHGGEAPVVQFQAKRYEWPDTLAMGRDRRIYVILNQLQRQKNYHEGKDLRVKPYRLVSFPYRPARESRNESDL